MTATLRRLPLCLDLGAHVVRKPEVLARSSFEGYNLLFLVVPRNDGYPGETLGIVDRLT